MRKGLDKLLEEQCSAHAGGFHTAGSFTITTNFRVGRSSQGTLGNTPKRSSSLELESDEAPALGTPGSQVFGLGLNGTSGFPESPACLGLLSLHHCVRQFQGALCVYTLHVLSE